MLYIYFKTFVFFNGNRPSRFKKLLEKSKWKSRFFSYIWHCWTRRRKETQRISSFLLLPFTFGTKTCIISSWEIDILANVISPSWRVSWETPICFLNHWWSKILKVGGLSWHVLNFEGVEKYRPRLPLSFSASILNNHLFWVESSTAFTTYAYNFCRC